MFTCGECVDVECEGHENPEQPACDEFTTEMWEEVPGVETLEILQLEDVQVRLADIEEQITQLSELVSTMEGVFAAMNRAYMGEER